MVFKLFKKNNYVNVNLDSQIKEIATGLLGRCEKYDCYELYTTDDIHAIYAYEDEFLRIEYRQDGFNSKYSSSYQQQFNIYYNGVQVYPGCISMNEWYSKFLEIYNKSLAEKQAKEEERARIEAQREKHQRVNKIFELIYPDEYIDDKISITNIEQCWSKSYYSTEEGGNVKDIYYKGIISLCDGIVVCNTSESIYHPGKWEDYVISLVDYFEEDRKRIQLQKIEQERAEKERLKLIQLHKYEQNHVFQL